MIEEYLISLSKLDEAKNVYQVDHRKTRLIEEEKTRNKGQDRASNMLSTKNYPYFRTKPGSRLKKRFLSLGFKEVNTQMPKYSGSEQFLRVLLIILTIQRTSLKNQ
ncbi:hypothetical protein EDEG_00281 [Edhazardia aedis USNM 41457]|uniref:Uncharacterized protein n=1 Tax=Edhazardia aedis (strain USNM 41457) TaxID=1003232 RepID=J9DII0_EDHAE|nr:hypothetical protein EDEG_00281 [Edhazardia aedis USNM 41457]|eukprot:EJW02425.1 hypothetical protein EDEG_00281 [Edhazardia aedis USNM 41457]